MALVKIGIGTVANDGTGDLPRVAGAKINTAFDLVDANEADILTLQGDVGDIETAMGGLSFVALTQAEYDLLTPDADTIYFITDVS